MGMVYTLEEAVQIVARDAGFDDTDLDWFNTATGISITLECKRESRSLEIARLIPVAQHTNEEETQMLVEVLEEELTGEAAAILSELTCMTESTYRIIRKALEILDEATSEELDADVAQRAAFCAAAKLRNICK
jgi:hypothetical protein